MTTTTTIVYRIRRGVWHVRAIVDGRLVARVYIVNRASAALRSFRQEVGK